MKALTVLVLLSVPALLAAQDQPPSAPRTGGTLTRSADLYQTLESDLLEAQQAKDRSAVRRMIESGFEVSSAERSSAISVDQWERSWMAADVRSFAIRNISVREFGNLAVVSFLLDRRGETSGRSITPTVYVVDIWRHDTGKLAVRYLSTPLKPVAQLSPAAKQ